MALLLFAWAIVDLLLNLAAPVAVIGLARSGRNLWLAYGAVSLAYVLQGALVLRVVGACLSAYVFAFVQMGMETVPGHSLLGLEGRSTWFQMVANAIVGISIVPTALLVVGTGLSRTWQKGKYRVRFPASLSTRCVFRTMPISDSGRSRSPIPEHADQRSGPSRSRFRADRSVRIGAREELKAAI
jgi:hypothetical protein